MYLVLIYIFCSLLKKENPTYVGVGFCVCFM